jgi:hypothetical protein
MFAWFRNSARRLQGSSATRYVYTVTYTRNPLHTPQRSPPAGILRNTLSLAADMDPGGGWRAAVGAKKPGGDVTLRREHKKSVRAEGKRVRREAAAAALESVAHRMSTLVAARARSAGTSPGTTRV